MNKPSVCICIPNYNNEKTIAETLDSLLGQTYKNFKIKIFDNASTDNSISILQEYESKYNFIEVFQNETNIGGEANFTKCIEGLEGEYGAIFHADDLYHPKMIETQIYYLQKKDILAIFVRADLIDEKSNNIGEQFFPTKLKHQEYYQFGFQKLFSLILRYDNFLITPSVMAKTKIYKTQIRSWNGYKFKTSADLDVWLRFSEIGNIGIITKKLISYRISNASFSYRVKFSRTVPRDMFLVLDYYLKRYKNIKFKKADYEFLKFKDNILIVGNNILNHKILLPSDIELPSFSVIKEIIFNKRKMKIVIYAIILKFFLFLSVNKILLYIVKKVNSIS